VLLSIFAGLAVLLAAVGLYGVVSYSISQRTHEIGIRMALGARPLDVARMVVWQAGRVTLTAAVVGLALAAGLMRLVAGLLFGVTPTDPLVFSMAAVGLGAVALVACLVPVRRATAVDPVTALRCE